jgi:DNA polymerase I-like protein with 3'-5' exonuclease and polymerase domains
MDIDKIFKEITEGPVAVDLETCDPVLTTLYPAWIEDNLPGHIAGICLATKDNEYYIPIGHEEGFNFPSLLILQKLEAALNSGSHPVIFFNAHYDYGWLKGRHGIRINRPIYDGMIAAPLIDEKLLFYNLDSLCKKYLKVSKSGAVMEQEIAARYGITGKAHKGHLWRLPYEFVEEYGKQDARITYDLWEYQKKRIKEDKLERVLELELALIEPLIDVRKHGVRIDVPRIALMKEKYRGLCEQQLTELSTIAGCPVLLNGDNQKEYRKKFPGKRCLNIGSAKQMAELCDELNIPYNKTETGTPSFAADKATEEASFLVNKIVLAKRYGNKVISTYLEGYFEKYLIGDRLHPQYNQLRGIRGEGTITGRFSCCNPNLQNIPARDKMIGPDMMSLFLPDEGKVFWCGDYSAQEPRLTVHLAVAMGNALGDNNVEGAALARSEKFQERDRDFHTEVSKAVIERMILNGVITFESFVWYSPIPKDWKGNEKDWAIKCFRPPAKTIGLGTIYSMGTRRLQEKLGLLGIHLELTEVKELQDSVFEAIPFLKTIDKYKKDMLERTGYVSTYLGRRNRIKEREIPEFFKAIDEFGNEKWTVKRHSFPDKLSAAKFKAMAVMNKRKVGEIARKDSYKALNAYIQGSAADQSKLAILATYRAGILPQIFVHDSQIQSIYPEQAELCVQLMEQAAQLNVTSKVDYKIGNTWAEVK